MAATSTGPVPGQGEIKRVLESCLLVTSYGFDVHAQLTSPPPPSFPGFPTSALRLPLVCFSTLLLTHHRPNHWRSQVSDPGPGAVPSLDVVSCLVSLYYHRKVRLFSHLSSFWLQCLTCHYQLQPSCWNQIASFLMTAWCSIVSIPKGFFSILSSVIGHLWCFYIVANILSTAINIVLITVLIYL